MLQQRRGPSSPLSISSFDDASMKTFSLASVSRSDERFEMDCLCCPESLPRTYDGAEDNPRGSYVQPAAEHATGEHSGFIDPAFTGNGEADPAGCGDEMDVEMEERFTIDLDYDGGTVC
jgi:hypothetical protein